MPPKGSKKTDSPSTTPKSAKTTGAATKTPSKLDTPSKHKTPQSKTPAVDKDGSEKKSPSKRAKLEEDLRTLPNTGTMSNHITVTYEHSESAKQTKTGFTHSLKLSGTGGFKLIGTASINDGPYKGRQIIIIEPPQSFEFTRLNQDIRQRVYDFYFACKGVLDDPIPIEGKRKHTGDPYAKAYSEGSKFRVAILATNKQVYDEALPVLYAKAIRVPDPTALLSFLGVLPEPLVERLRQIKIASYKIGSRNAMNHLRYAKSMIQLDIEAGVAAAAEPAKAAEMFHGDIRHLVDAITSTLRERKPEATKLDALDAIKLGKDALTFKDKKYSTEEREEFFEALQAKVQ